MSEPLSPLERRNAIHPRFVPLRCNRCDHPLREWNPDKDDWNQFTCGNPDGPHMQWIQSPPVAYVVLLNVDDYTTYTVERAIPPIGEWCFPGGYVDYGETAEETIVHETAGEACIRIAGKPVNYLGQLFEPGLGVTVIGFLVRINRADVDDFAPNKEATARREDIFWDLDPNILAFNGNRLMLEAARNLVRAERDRKLAQPFPATRREPL